ncbi:MAG: cyclodeaminase/cyclohydrolase family protein [bacterium]|nr:cyclodeaminase/cyclohydrolase family protein [bacterium]
MLRTKSINEFLNLLASDAPTPGGGSVAALSGALGCAILIMVCDLTIGKKKYLDVTPDLEAIKPELENLLEELTDSIDRDALAYDKFTEARQLPKNTDVEIKMRREAMQVAMRIAAETPKATARYCHMAMKMGMDVTQKGNTNVLSDAGVGMSCLMTGLTSALMNIAINLGGIEDEAYTSQMKEEIRFLKSEGSRMLHEAYEFVSKSIGME